MSSTVMHKRWANTEDQKVVNLRPLAHYFHPVANDLRTALCGAKILGIPSFEPFEICEECQVLHAAGDSAPLPK
jgi:hypothetical protein